MTEKIKGKIEAVSQKDKTYGIKIGDDWYNGFGTCPHQKGQEVELEWEQRGDFKNIKAPKTTKSDQKTPEPTGSMERLIEILSQNKFNAQITEKVSHPNNEPYNMKEYGASYSINLVELTAEKGAEIYDLLQKIIDSKKKADKQ